MIEVGGRSFVVPAGLTAVGNRDRVALALLTSGACRFGDALVESAVTPGAVDLSLVRSGRAPLLSSHCASLDTLLGQVIEATVDGPVLQCLVRFARGPEPDRVWAMLRDGFPLSLSAGATIEGAERIGVRDGQPLYQATRWKLREVSVVVFGRDEQAFVRRLNDAEDPVAMLDQMRSGRRSAEIEQALCLHRWRRWGAPAGLRLAEQLGIDPDRMGDLLASEIASHCDQLTAEHC